MGLYSWDNMILLFHTQKEKKMNNSKKKRENYALLN